MEMEEGEAEMGEGEAENLGLDHQCPSYPLPHEGRTPQGVAGRKGEMNFVGERGLDLEDQDFPQHEQVAVTSLLPLGTNQAEARFGQGGIGEYPQHHWT